MKNVIKISVALLMLASCSQSFDMDMLVDSPKDNKVTSSKNPYYVDYDTALQEAINFMTDGKTTRADGRSFEVKEHFEYVANRPSFYNTRATSNQDTIDVRFHVINFADNGGFALVSADSRTTYRTYYHCNWGWGGQDNGYVLNTFNTSEGNYNNTMSFLYNIHPRN